jgi:hypothetical protein
MNTKFQSENQKGRNYLKDPGADGKIILEQILEVYIRTVWTGRFILRKIGTNGYAFVNTVINLRVP